MITGSWPSTDMWWMRASGCTPSAFRPRSLTIITPVAPSQIWLAFAALMQPPSISSFTPAMPSSVASKRMPSSTVCCSPIAPPSPRRTSTGRISAAKRPARVASIARRWLSSAYASSWSFESPYFFASISAPVNWLNSTSG